MTNVVDFFRRDAKRFLTTIEYSNIPAEIIFTYRSKSSGLFYAATTFVISLGLSFPLE